jgi:hypothetical protein
LTAARVSRADRRYVRPDELASRIPPDEHLKRLAPLQHEHIKMLGNFPFTLPHELAAGQRRQLRGLGDLA